MLDESGEDAGSSGVDESGVDESGVDQARESKAPEDVLILEEAVGALELPIWEPTGDSRVDRALELLSALDADDVSGHMEVYQRIHDDLRAALTDADAAP